MTRVCKQCSVEKPIDDFYKVGRAGKKTTRLTCKECDRAKARESGAETYARRKARRGELDKAYRTAWSQTNKEQQRQYQREKKREYNKKWRAAAMEALGNYCWECTIDDVRVLHFDHFYGDGHAERYSIDRTTFYRDIALGKRDDIQLLCANCHMIKTYHD